MDASTDEPHSTAHPVVIVATAVVAVALQTLVAEADPAQAGPESTGLPVSDPWVLLAIGVFVCALAAAAFLSLAELALVSVNKVRIGRLAEEGHRRARALVELFADEDVSYLTGLLVAINVLIIIMANVTAWIVIRTGCDHLAVPAAALQIVVALMVAEIAPKTLASHDPERYALAVALPIRALVRSLPFRVGIGTVNAVSRPLRRALGVSELHRRTLITEEELEVMADVAEEEGVIEAEEGQMIDGIIAIGDRTAREVMVPRLDVIALEGSATVGEAADLISEEGKSRVPVYEGNHDNMIGVLYANDILAFLSQPDARDATPVRELVRPAFSVPDTMYIDNVLKELQARKVHIALVFDEHGGFDGVVTIEDILEEIVGGIQDEHDDEAEGIVQTGDDEWLVQATTPRHELEAALGIELPDGEYDTTSGFVVTTLNTLPDPGEEILYGGYAFVVGETEGPRIKTVIVRRLSAAEAFDRDAEGPELRAVEYEDGSASRRKTTRRGRGASGRPGPDAPAQ